MFEKFAPQPDCTALADAAAEWKRAVRVGQYRLSETAVFWPDGRYVPLAEVTEAAVTTKSIAAKGCCGMTLPNPAVVFQAAGKKYLLLTDSKKQAEQLAEKLCPAAGRD